MAYSRTTWVNNAPPSMNAANLNKMEGGIAEAHDAIQAILDDGGGGGGGFTVHALLTGRGAVDQHPISAITGLQDALDAAAGGAHTHPAAAIISGVFDPSRLGLGATGGTTRFLREDSTWQEVEGGGGGGIVTVNGDPGPNVNLTAEDVSAAPGDHDHKGAYVERLNGYSVDPDGNLNFMPQSPSEELSSMAVVRSGAVDIPPGTPSGTIVVQIPDHINYVRMNNLHVQSGATPLPGNLPVGTIVVRTA